MVQRGGQVGGGVQGVTGQDEVEARRGEALDGRVGVRVEGAVLDEAAGGEAVPGTGEGGVGRGGAGVVGAVGREQGQHGGGQGRAGRAHFQDAERAVGGPAVDDPVEQCLHHAVGEAVGGCGLLPLFEEVLADGQQVAGVDAAAQHLGQLPQLAVDQQRDGAEPLVLRHQAPQRLLGAGRDVGEPPRLPVGPRQVVFGQQGQHQAHQPAVARCQAPGDQVRHGERRVGAGRQVAQGRCPAGGAGSFGGGGERRVAAVLPGGAGGGDTASGGLRQFGGRGQRGRRGGRRGVRGRAQDGALDGQRGVVRDAGAPGAALVDLGADGAVEVGVGDVPADLVGAAAAAPQVDDALLGGGAPDPYGSEGRGQVARGLPGRLVGQGDGGLQGAVQQDGVDRVAVGRVVEPVPREEFAVADVQGAQEPEPGSEVQSDAVAVLVVVGAGEGAGAAGLERGDVQRGGGGAQPGAYLGADDRLDLGAAGVPAADGEGAVGRGDGGLERGSRRVGPRDREGAGDLQVPHLHRAVQRPQSGRDGHLHVRGGGHQHVAADPVVAQPGHELGFDAAVPQGVGGGQAFAEQGVVEHSGAAGVQDEVLRGAVPVPVALPGVGGQVGDPAGVREVRLPVHVGAGREQGGDGGRGLARPVPVPVQGRHVRQAGSAQVRTQDRVRPDLHDDADALVREPCHGLGEADGFAHVAPPVRRVEFRAGQRGRGDGGDERHPCRAGGQAGEGGAQGFLDGIHGAAVEGVVQVQLAEEDVPSREVGAEGGQRVGGAGHGDVAVAVDPGDLQHAVEARQFRAGRVLGQPDGGHAAPARGGGLGAAALGQHQRSLLQGQRPGRVGGGHLADAVPGDRGGAQSLRGQECGQARLHGEQHRLGDLGPRPACRGGALQLLRHGPAQVRGQRGVGLLHGGAEDGLARHQVGGHPRPLGGVAGVDERHGAPLGPAGHGPAGRRVGEKVLQRVGGLPCVGGQHGGPVRVGAAPQRAGAGDVVELLRCRAAQPFGHARGQLPQCLGRPRGDHHRHGPVHRLRRGWSGRWWYDDGVGVGTAEAEGVHPHRGAYRAGQFDRRDGGGQAEGVEIDGRVERQGMQGGGCGPVAEHQDRLEQSGHARRGLQMAQVGLHRADGQRAGAAPGAEGAADCFGLGGVADGGAGAVRLEVDQVVRADAGLLAHRP